MKRFIILALLCATVALLLAACGGLSEAEERYNDGVDASEAGRFEEAVALYTEAIELDPDLVDAYVNRSQAYLELGRFDEALADANKAIQLEPELAGAYVNRAAAYSGLGRYDEALDDANKAIELEPELALAYVVRGIIYNDRVPGEEGDYSKALTDLNKAIELDPNLAKAYNARGAVHASLGDYEQALADFDKAIELDPELALAHNNRGFAHLYLNDFRQSIIDLDKAIELDPDLALAYSNRGAAHFALGEMEEAVRDSDRALELDSELVLAYSTRAQALLRLGRDAEAERDLVKACDLGDSNACELLAAAPTPEEARHILPQMILQLEDLPAGFDESYSSFDTLADQAEFSDDPDGFRRQLESWGFILSHSRFYTRDAAEGLLEVDSDIWLLEDEQGAEEAFLDVALFPVFGDVDLEELPEFPSFGDNSEAFFLSGRYLPFEGEEIAAEGFTVVIRSGQFLAALTMAYRTGEASQDEAIELATSLEARMTR